MADLRTIIKEFEQFLGDKVNYDSNPYKQEGDKRFLLKHLNQLQEYVEEKHEERNMLKCILKKCKKK